MHHISEQREQRNRELGESFRQASRESVVIVIGWLVFLIWTATVCAFGWGGESREPVPTWMGLPRWVIFGVILPWLAACGFTFWFTMFYMKDTDLDPDRTEETGENQEPEEVD